MPVNSRLPRLATPPSAPPALSSSLAPMRNSGDGWAHHQALCGPWDQSSQNLLLNLFNAPCLEKEPPWPSILPALSLCSSSAQKVWKILCCLLWQGLKVCIYLLLFLFILQDKSFTIVSCLFTFPENAVHISASYLCLFCPPICRMHPPLFPNCTQPYHTSLLRPNSSFTSFFRPYLKP